MYLATASLLTSWTEHEDLDDEARARAKGGKERAEQGRDDREHDGRR
jgi:hypothetical protein